MYEYVRKALDFVKGEGGVVPARKLHDYVELVHPWIGRENWHIVNAPIKDQPIEETGEILVPVGRHWHYNPRADILIIWVKETLDRHRREVERACAALTLPRYVKSAESKRTLPDLYELKTMIDNAIKVIEG